MNWKAKIILLGLVFTVFFIGYYVSHPLDKGVIKFQTTKSCDSFGLNPVERKHDLDSQVAYCSLECNEKDKIYFGSECPMFPSKSANKIICLCGNK